MKLEDKGNVVYSFSAQHSPVAELAGGETLVVETADCFDGQIHETGQILDAIDMNRINPATGPFYIPFAEPGDVLEIEILDIKVGQQGILVSKPGLGVLGHELSSQEVEILDLSAPSVTLAPGLTLPVQPMLGVIGVAPKEGEVGCGSPGPHGGNLDTQEICSGSKVFLPVFHPGALLALGDVHALMGDGEVSGAGIETSGEVKIRVSIRQDMQLDGPRVETDQGLYILCSASSLEEAIQRASLAGVEYLQAVHNLSFSRAYSLAGAACNLQISQVVNPLHTVKFFIPHSLMVLHK